MFVTINSFPSLHNIVDAVVVFDVVAVAVYVGKMKPTVAQILEVCI